MTQNDHKGSKELQAALTAWAEGDGLLETPFKRVLSGQEATSAGRAIIKACADKTTREKHLPSDTEDVRAVRQETRSLREV